MCSLNGKWQAELLALFTIIISLFWLAYPVIYAKFNVHNIPFQFLNGTTFRGLQAVVYFPTVFLDKGLGARILTYFCQWSAFEFPICQICI